MTALFQSIKNASMQTMSSLDQSTHRHSLKVECDHVSPVITQPLMKRVQVRLLARRWLFCVTQCGTCRCC